MESKSTIEQMAELLLRSSLGDVEKKIEERIEASFTACEAKLDGIKTELNCKISELEAIATEKPLAINFGTIEEPKKEVVHTQFRKILSILKSQKRIQKNIMLVGEAGSGKTHLAYNISQALGLEFYPMSVGLQTTKSDLLGFINAHGEYVTSPVREAFEKGGVLLLDEFDSTHAGVVTIINSLLANGHCSFPDKIVPKNDKFICLVACNTYGHGANIDYVGRNRLDGATLDRFIVVDVDYDKKLEETLTGNKEWLEIINKIRKNIEKQGIKMIVSPRASMQGADLLDNGFSYEEVLDMVVFKGVDLDTRTKCMQGIILGGQSEEKLKNVPLKNYHRTYDNLLIQIVTNSDDMNDIVRVQVLNNKEEFCLRYELPDKNYCIRFGAGWSWQFTGYDEMYFRTVTGASRSITDIEKVYINDMISDIISGRLRNISHQTIAFEFLKVRSRKKEPYAVVEFKAEG